MNEIFDAEGVKKVKTDKVKILLVDDNQLNLSALTAALGDTRLELVSAKSGAEALKCLLGDDFALVLLDVQMPDIDGFETARLIRLREKTKNIPIIFITAMYREEAEAFKGYSLGAVDYIIKPYSKDVLKSKVSVFVNLYLMREEVKRQAEVILAHEKREHEARLIETKRQLEGETFKAKEEHRITQKILEHAPVGIVHIGNDYLIKEVNTTIANLAGSDSTKLLNTNVFEAFPWLPNQPFKDALENGKQFFAREFAVYTARQNHDSATEENANGNSGAHNGTSEELESQDYFDLAIWPVESDDQRVIGAVLIAVDVSERVEHARYREDFVATLTHDLQTPVIATDRAIELLLNSASHKLDDSLIMLVTKLRQNNGNLLKMIQQLLDVYRYEANAQQHFFDTINLGITVESCLDHMSAIVKDHDLSVQLEIPSNLKKVWADHTAIRRVFTNLLENAIKYSPKGSTIKVGARNLPGHVLFSINNTGAGIEPDDLPKLFKRYWHKSPEKTYKSSWGLGLYLCKKIVEAHNGEIWCESDPGQLTTFHVKLPVQKPEPKPERQHKNDLQTTTH